MTPSMLTRPGVRLAMMAGGMSLLAACASLPCLGASADAREGVTSFLEKRTPRYPGRVSRDLPDIWPHWRRREFS